MEEKMEVENIQEREEFQIQTPRKRFYKCKKCGHKSAIITMNYYKKQATVTCIFTHCGGKFYYSIKAEDKFVDVYKKYISEVIHVYKYSFI
ncbi:uncharacterized protein LOC105833414 isoform X2 [Monomorium pharaonis]|uniref:uncharacterized protein LOC105833414 isoform X2 n=1 Tax=Monomorium pharaonis TaxID=307658 RepID=UPI00063FC338|nr:uncharacterized protein LOC105833414 isoform X2 [Monomorium pharaonis]